MLADLVNTLLGWVAHYGFAAIFVLMALESACVPVPSEPVMVYGGYLVYAGHMTFLEAALAGTLGNLAGSLVAYLLGIRGGRALERMLARRSAREHLEAADRFFLRHGEAAVCIGRMLPVIRTFISLPAGVARMDWRRFVGFTLLGCIPWNAGLVWAGLAAGPHWQRALDLLHEANYIVLGAAGLAVVGAYVWWRVRGRAAAPRGTARDERGAEPEQVVPAEEQPARRPAKADAPAPEDSGGAA